jgi:hypothetical protein
VPTTSDRGSRFLLTAPTGSSTTPFGDDRSGTWQTLSRPRRLLASIAATPGKRSRSWPRAR